METRFLNASTVIESLRDNGFTSTAYALAELIDNSIQAGANRIEMGFIEKQVGGSSNRNTYNVNQISIWDNGKGMNPEELKLAMQFGGSLHRNDPNGMGKFGMGLPNSSISQCKRVDVWSWRNGAEPYHTYLDIDEMKQGSLEIVPEPVRKNIPEIFMTSFFQTRPSSGTLIVWSKLDRLSWKTGHSNFKHCEYIVGRMYREYLNDNRIKIDSITYRQSEEKLLSEYTRESFKANDPMYLLKNTSLPTLPGNYSGEAFFELLDEENVEIDFKPTVGEPIKGTVLIRTSIVKKSIAKFILETQSGSQKLGQTVWGKHCAKNIGVSVMRSGRELILRDSFLSSDLRPYKGRFIGIEVKFSPSLDTIFGVTNNKQDAVKFIPYELGELASQAGFESEIEYLNDLKENDDPLTCTLKIVQVVKSHIQKAEKQLKLIPVERVDYNSDNGANGSASHIATVGSQYREGQGLKARDSGMPDENELEDMLKKAGLSGDEAKEKIASVIANGDLFLIETAPTDSDAFFDVSTRRGITLVLFNSNHVFYRKFISQLPDDQLSVMQTVIAGFARVMNETSDERRVNYLNTIRRDWGRVITDFLSEKDKESEF